MSRALFITTLATCLASSPAFGRRGASSEPELELKPKKDALVLARDPGTAIRITLKGAEPKGDNAPRVAASVGSLGELKKTKAGQWEIPYTIPESKPPSVAVIIAEIETNTGIVSGASTIRLLGKARVSVKTEKNARVHLKVAGRREGPFQADEAGVVETSITVPPGYEEFLIVAVDKAGNRSRRKKALAVPPFPMVAIGPAPTELTADGTIPLTVSVAAVSNRGDLVPFKGKCRTTEAGKLKKLDTVGLIGRWQLVFSSIGSGQARVTCSTGSAKHKTATLELQLLPRALTSLAIQGPTECAAGQTCDLVIEARDVANNPIVALPVLEANADLGSIAMRGPDDTGAATWSFTAPDTYEPDRVATVTLAAGDVRAQSEIALTPAEVAELSFVSAGENVLLGSEVRLPVRAVDAYGNAVPVEPPPTLSADVGEATWVTEGEDAPAVVYRSPERASTETDLIRVSYQELSTEIPLVLEGRWRHTHVSARAGASTLRNGLWGPMVGVDVSSSLPPLDGRFAAAVRVAGIRSQNTSNINPTGGEVVARVTQVLWMIPILGGVDVTAVDAESWGLVAGIGGGGLVVLTSLDVTELVTDKAPPSRESVVFSPAASVHLRGTIALGLGDIEIGADTMYAWTRSAQSIRGDVLAFTGTVGWRFNWEDALW